MKKNIGYFILGVLSVGLIAAGVLGHRVSFTGSNVKDTAYCNHVLLVDSNVYANGVKLGGGGAGTFVPYTGATANIDLNGHYFTDRFGKQSVLPDPRELRNSFDEANLSWGQAGAYDVYIGSYGSAGGNATSFKVKDLTRNIELNAVNGVLVSNGLTVGGTAVVGTQEGFLTASGTGSATVFNLAVTAGFTTSFVQSTNNLCAVGSSSVTGTTLTVVTLAAPVSGVNNLRFHYILSNAH